MYKLKYKILAHKDDARSLSILEENYVVSGSRDSTCKTFKKDIKKDIIEKINDIKFDKISISSLLCFGSIKDRKIAVEGHEQNISCLSYSDRNKHIISGSWDCKIKVWDILNGNLIKTLFDHNKAVWCLECVEGYKLMLSGSADTKIILWKDYNKIKEFNGHKQSVRDIKILNDKRTFISCSNDCNIIKWDIINGTQLEIIGNHKNFIYSLSILSEKYFVSVGENGEIKIWENYNLKQEIKVPCYSIWCVDSLNENEFVIGCSDGYLRIYTNDILFTKPLEDKLQDKLEIDKKNIPDTDKKISNALELDDDPNIPDISIGLIIPGKTEGQVTLVRDEGKIKVYEWKSLKKKWELMGDVLSNINDENYSHKIYYEGKEYDYVFDVDLEGIKMAKLPYNIGDDKYKIAEEFLKRNGLHTSEIYVNQIVEFIKTNVTESELLINEKSQTKNLFKYTSVNLDGLFKNLFENIKNEKNILKESEIIIIKEQIEKLLKNKNIGNNYAISEIELDKFPFIQFFNNIDICNSLLMIPYIDLLRILSLDYSFCIKYLTNDHLKQLFFKYLNNINLSEEKIIVLLLKAINNMFVIFDTNQICSIVNLFVEEPNILLFMDKNIIWERNKLQIVFCKFLYNMSVVFLSVKDEIAELINELYNQIIYFIIQGLKYFTSLNNIENEFVLSTLLNTLENIYECQKYFSIENNYKNVIKSILDIIIDKQNSNLYSKNIQNLANNLIKFESQK